MYLSCKELQESLDQFFHYIAGKTEAKVTKKFISSSTGHLGQNTELSKIGTPTTFDQNGLSARTHTQGKAKCFLSLWDYVVYGLVLLQHFFLLFFKANVPHLILVHCIPVKTLGCKPNKIASCSLKTKQNKTKNEEEEESVRRFLDCRLEDLARGRDRYCQSRYRSKNRTPGNFLERRPLPAVPATALSQMNSQYPVCLSHLFLVLSPGRGIPKTEQRDLPMLWLPEKWKKMDSLASTGTWKWLFPTPKTSHNVESSKTRKKKKEFRFWIV